MIKIVTKKKWNGMMEREAHLVEELDKLMAAHSNLHKLYKGQVSKYNFEMAEKNREIEELQSKLRKCEHDKATAYKKLKKYE